MSTVEDGTAFRVMTYIRMVEKALNKALTTFRGGDNERYVLNLAKDYLSDAKYYFSIRDYITALACISYAEGLLDALKFLGYVDIDWVREKPRKVLIGGTFDILHPGHIYYIKEASKYGLVYAVVATDRNVKKIKGREPILPQEHRLELVSSIKYVYKAFLGDERDLMKPIEQIKPDLVILGPDQPINEEVILRRANKLNLNLEVIRLPNRVGGTEYSSTNIIRKILQRYCRDDEGCKK